MATTTKLQKSDISALALTLGFLADPAVPDKLRKQYRLHANYAISLDLTPSTTNACQINWGPSISVGRATVCNFSQAETLVVLECVDRLLEKGYAPHSLVLEKAYSVARNDVYLDILIKEPGGEEPYLMVECKNWGAIKREHDTMIADGGQLFGYFVQARKTKFLCLYASKLSGGKVERQYEVIDTSRLRGTSKVELWSSWDKDFFKSGIFEDICLPYAVREEKLLRRQLTALTAEDSKSIFNRFAEILRKHAVSDKPNAFNKIFNLFICKILDEEKSEDEILEFQWPSGESNETVMSRLNDLYRRGMEQFLSMTITDFSQSEFDTKMSGLPDANRDELLRVFTELRLYKNNEFTFKEVINKRTFDENCAIVREVVKLIQEKKIRYDTKQQFLGDFFERLLNTSVKQEAGQFFTPLPITRFICDALPLDQIIDKKLKGHDDMFLPYAIDYASGSGHFLTEYMARVDKRVKLIPESGLRKSAAANREAWVSNYKWAKEFVYGVEKDYRLSKTTKVSCFLNGDGEANIICGDGLDSFTSSQSFHGRLKKQADKAGKYNPSGSSSRDIGTFDVVVANPPYSVPGFMQTLHEGQTSFELYDSIGQEGKEIECLFIERTKQLLRAGKEYAIEGKPVTLNGVAGLILPVSVLTTGGVYSQTRKLLLRSFLIKGIVELGGNTFMATSTNTVVLFIERRSEDEYRTLERQVTQAIDEGRDFTAFAHPKRQVQSALATFCQEVRGGMALTEYLQILKGAPTLANAPEWLRDYQAMFSEESGEAGATSAENIALAKEGIEKRIRKVEEEKICYFLLAKNQDVVLARAPEKKSDEVKFLGYEFSNRRGSEGIKIHQDEEGNIASSLYSETSIEDTSKVAFYVRKNFEGKASCWKAELPVAAPKGLVIKELVSLMQFDSPEFSAELSMSAESLQAHWNSFAAEVVGRDVDSKGDGWTDLRIADITGIEVGSGNGAPQGAKYFKDGRNQFVRVSSLKRADKDDVFYSDADNLVTDAAVKDYGLVLFKKGTIVFPKSGKAIDTNKIAILGNDCYVANHLATLYVEDPAVRLYLFWCLKAFKTSNLAPRSGYPSISRADLNKFRLPWPTARFVENLKAFTDNARRLSA